jgi:amino acid efflux transporter
MAQLAGEFRDPGHDLPRAMALAFAIVAVLYVALAVATIAVTAGSGSRVPLADLIAVGFGRAGRDATAVLAVALTMGTGNVYTAGSAKLAASLAQAGGLPRWMGGDAERSVPRRPLAALAATTAILLGALVAGVISAAALVRATSACFILVYVLALASAVRISRGALRTAAVISLALICVVGVFSSWYLFVPAVAALLSIGFRHTATRHVQDRRDQLEKARIPPTPVAPDPGDETPLRP